MKKFLLSGLVIFTFVSYVIFDRFGPSSPDNQSNFHQPASNFSSQGPIPPDMMNGAYKDGQYTGEVTDTFYGNVQVKAVISGGKITDVQFLKYPKNHNTSIMINSQAMPILIQEAIQAQSAAVDGVSGATQTSSAFRESLQSALNQAK